MTVIQNLIAKGVLPMDAKMQAGADRYESRGKGKSRSKISPRFGRSASRYQPHSGAKENAKAAARMAKAAAA